MVHVDIGKGAVFADEYKRPQRHGLVAFEGNDVVSDDEHIGDGV